ncbi:MerR family transcriptional regulator [Paenibacillus sp. 1P07SE]|uniref:MerR family transcriptional regulator n=1 Tax=Paenibacillus sp. 1P07SE TaxID=3132209 RepID=UPI0039A5A9AB
MRIQEVADRLGTTARAIRLYEQRGLLQPVKDAGSGYRRFTEPDMHRLQTIVALRELGLSLDAIAGLFAVGGQPGEWAELLQAARASLYRQHLAAAQGLQALDQVIAALERAGEVPLQEMQDAARHLRVSRMLRESWQDRWDYDRLARRMDEGKASMPLAFTAGLSDALYEHTLETIAAVVAPMPGEQGLDLGTGVGNLAWRLAASGAEVIGVEQSIGMLKMCRQRHPQLSVRQGNLLSLPFADQTADFITCSFAMHHLTTEQQQLALQEVGRVLKPQGRLCLAGLALTDEHKSYNGDQSPPWYPLSEPHFMAWCTARSFSFDKHLLDQSVLVLGANLMS